MEDWALAAIVAALVAAAGVILLAGTRLTRVADRLADATGLGEATFGAVMLGATTSLPGIVASVSAASQGHPELAISNALGGIAAQTVFLAAADLAWPRANLEHAAASVENLLQGGLLLTMLSMVVLALGAPDVVVGWVHPVTPLMIAFWLFGVRMVRQAGADPLWRPTQTSETRADEPAPDVPAGADLTRAWATFAVLGAVVAGAGFVVAESGLALSARLGWSESVVGVLLTAVATSLPELVTSVAAVRQGALMLAVGGIIGGNSFDVLFVSLADFAYADGSIYAAATERQLFTLGLGMAMTGILLLGMLRRERHGPVRVGSETVALVVLYVAGSAFEVWRG